MAEVPSVATLIPAPPAKDCRSILQVPQLSTDERRAFNVRYRLLLCVTSDDAVVELSTGSRKKAPGAAEVLGATNSWG